MRALRRSRQFPLAETQSFPNPSCRANADEDRTRRTQSNLFMRVNGQIFRRERAGVLDDVAGHPVVRTRSCEILNQLAKSAPVKLRATFPRRTDEANRESLVVSHRDQRCLAIAREPFDAYALGIYGFVCLEIV